MRVCDAVKPEPQSSPLGTGDVSGVIDANSTESLLKFKVGRYSTVCAEIIMATGAIGSLAVTLYRSLTGELNTSNLLATPQVLSSSKYISDAVDSGAFDWLIAKVSTASGAAATVQVVVKGSFSTNP